MTTGPNHLTTADPDKWAHLGIRERTCYQQGYADATADTKDRIAERDARHVFARLEDGAVVHAFACQLARVCRTASESVAAWEATAGIRDALTGWAGEDFPWVRLYPTADSQPVDSGLVRDRVTQILKYEQAREDQIANVLIAAAKLCNVLAVTDDRGDVLADLLTSLTGEQSPWPSLTIELSTRQ